MKPYVTMEEVISTQGADSRTHRFLTAENGCTNGCASGTTIYASNEFSDKPGVHNDQEGFYVLEGEEPKRDVSLLRCSGFIVQSNY